MCFWTCFIRTSILFGNLLLDIVTGLEMTKDGILRLRPDALYIARRCHDFSNIETAVMYSQAVYEVGMMAQGRSM